MLVFTSCSLPQTWKHEEKVVSYSPHFTGSKLRQSWHTICFGWCGQSVEELALSPDHTVSDWCFKFIDHHSISLSWSCLKEKPLFSNTWFSCKINSLKLQECVRLIYISWALSRTPLCQQQNWHTRSIAGNIHTRHTLLMIHSPYDTLPVGYKHASQISCSKLIKLLYEQPSPWSVFQPILRGKTTSLSKQNSQTGQKSLYKYYNWLPNFLKY